MVRELLFAMSLLATFMAGRWYEQGENLWWWFLIVGGLLSVAGEALTILRLRKGP